MHELSVIIGSARPGARRDRAMSLIELLIAMVILSIMVRYAIMSYIDLQKTARMRRVQNDLNVLKSAITTYMADENNKKRERPRSLGDLEYSVFRIEDPDDSTSIKFVKKNFIERVPKSPFGGEYWGDLYYVYTRDNESQKVFREAYTDATCDRFSLGGFSQTFYSCIPPYPNAYMSAQTGEISMSTRDAKNGAPNDAVILMTTQSHDIVASKSRPSILDFTFTYRQRVSDSAVLNTSENRILETAANENYSPSAMGVVFLFKGKPAVIPEAQLTSKPGIGFKFSDTTWELYDSPNGTSLNRVAFGGWSAPEGEHVIKFIFRSSNVAECYLDGDMKGSAQFGAAGAGLNSFYVTLSPDMFGMMAIPPAPYSPVPTLVDCDMTVKQIKITGVDFSTYYPLKIPPY